MTEQQTAHTSPFTMTAGTTGTVSATFAERHIGPRGDEYELMVRAIGYDTVDALVDDAVPHSIRSRQPLQLPAPASEVDALSELRALATRNSIATSMIGQGYYGTFTPSVIVRRLVENPAWYTAYTPYQPEISQGRLEALLNFQTVVSDLTGLPVSNASLLDEGTAAAEAMTLARRSNRKSESNRFLIDADTFAQTIAVVRTRADALGIELVVADTSEGLPEGDFFGVLLQYPGSSGLVRDVRPLIDAAHAHGALVSVASDLLALTLLTPPGENGADIVVGSSQRFGVPLFYGGPHAGFMSVRQGLERSLPGRLVGVSRDVDGAPAYRLALQTREQHIRREKATSNICTAQVLLAVVASMYAVYHGPDGLRSIAGRVHGYAEDLAASLRGGGVEVVHDTFFDTVLARVPGRAAEIVAAARENGVWLRLADADHVGISCDEKTDATALGRVCQAFGVTLESAAAGSFPEPVRRTSEYLTHPVFNTHRSETSMLRYMRKLADYDYALDRGMIPLGSCTMKLNATTEMEPVTWPEFSDLHPFAPIADAAGYVTMIAQLEQWLAEVTGYAKVSIQPNAGSQGEFSGLLAIRAYHRANGQDRNVCLIPASAHGTNAASAVMAGMRVVVVKGNDDGTIDLDDLRAKAAEHADALAAIMITYPSTHGVYEESVTEVCRIVHDHGGQVYVDGANLNALLGLAKPGEFGGDVSHLNLHKTFCIPHGGGGPGVGPVAVAEHLAPYLPNHPLLDLAGPATGIGPISAAPFGSAGVLAISWAYMRMMGADGLTDATKAAVLTANYVAKRLGEHYPVLYTGENGLVAHECILDLRPITKATGISVDDVAKRLIDYGFHAPTMSFPVAGTLMVEPTESEDLGELDRFCDAMIAIKHEIDRVAAGEWPKDDNPLSNAPHTAASVVNDKWDHAYTREEAAFPQSVDRTSKYWPPVRRIDGAHGDRNLICSCPPPEAFA
jgi:glycine dehydrogenase